MDESNPHMHLVYIPVVHTLDKNKNEIIQYGRAFVRILFCKLKHFLRIESVLCGCNTRFVGLERENE